MSLPIMETRVNASGPLPIRVAPNRRPLATVFDQIRLSAGEDELAVRNIDLSAAEFTA